MSAEYAAFFRRCAKSDPKPPEPYDWQARLAENANPANRLLQIPTGFGKTLGVLCAWLYHRVERNDDAWPRRLVWMLPMRTLVEQTRDVCEDALQRLGWLAGDPPDAQARQVGVHVLMGGADVGPYHIHPEAPAVLIGTQDMLLSRALNRGYGAGRARWPVDFGLLSCDALWVLDEVQLMDVGLATALQLAAFRAEDAAAGRLLRPSYTWAMSATLQRSWLQFSPESSGWAADVVDHRLTLADEATDLFATTRKILVTENPHTPAEMAARALQEAKENAGRVLVVCNTVERAQATFAEIRKRASTLPHVQLIHSRFRGQERGALNAAIREDQQTGILVATQVIEAGVDISASVLLTEVCPWPSLVQRLGRLARRGGTGRAIVFHVDTAKQAAPYASEALDATWDALGVITELHGDGSPRALQAFERERPDLAAGLYPFEPRHVILREDVADLFDTTPDLSGGDVDVSRFVRDGDERDVTVAWVEFERDAAGRVLAPDKAARPVTASLCAVPFLQAQDWLCGKMSKGSAPKRLRDGTDAFVWDYLEDTWRRAERSDLRPGATVLVSAKAGGYDVTLGFQPSSTKHVEPIPLMRVDAPTRSDNADGADAQSETAWQSIAFHSRAVAERGRSLTAELRLPEPLARTLALAARLHDVGKAHAAFQSAIIGEDVPSGRRRPPTLLAKAPKKAWNPRRDRYRLPPADGTARGELRRGFRHELASLLALFDVLRRHAAPTHPARLGPFAACFEDIANELPTAPPTRIEREILDLDAAGFDLLAFLVVAHHGKVRARLHANPADQRAAVRDGGLPIRGVRDGDHLPAVDVPCSDGGVALLPESRLTLEPAMVGLSPVTGRSWTERVDTLRRTLGPFSLAYLEAILRATDVQASSDPSLVDDDTRRLARDATAVGTVVAGETDEDDGTGEADAVNDTLDDDALTTAPDTEEP